MITVDIRKPLKKYLPYLIQAQEDHLNEADTVQRLIKVFEDVFGYDAITDISREMAIKEKYVDIALKVNGAVEILVEAKSGGTALKDKQLDQAKHYAAEANIPWVILTNGIDWILYHLTFDEGINYDKVINVNLANDSFDAACSSLSVLNKKNVAADGLDEFWEQKVALNPASIGKVLFHEDVLNVMRRELKKLIHVRIDEEDLANALHSMLSVEAREYVGPMRIRRKHKNRLKPSNGLPATGGDAPALVRSLPAATADTE